MQCGLYLLIFVLLLWSNGGIHGQGATKISHRSESRSSACERPLPVVHGEVFELHTFEMQQYPQRGHFQQAMRAPGDAIR